MTIPDVSAAEGVVTHWVRLYSKDSAIGAWPDSIDRAVAAIVEPLFGEADYQNHELIRKLTGANPATPRAAQP